MKFHLISETIDGSIKDIVQLKTLDNSLEYSQMFDALEDCPKDFQAKLIQALNSVGETIQVPPVDVFNIVLCASNAEEDKDATKKMYNWWKAVFEILSKCDIPDDRKAEYDDLVDKLMSEILKSGDSNIVAESSSDIDIIRKELNSIPADVYDHPEDGLCIDVDVGADPSIRSDNVCDVIGKIVRKVGYDIDDVNEWERDIATLTLVRNEFNESNDDVVYIIKNKGGYNLCPSPHSNGDYEWDSDSAYAIQFDTKRRAENFIRRNAFDSARVVEIQKSRLMQEEYEQANIEDEEVMLKDMEFAISKIGEIANRVQDLINFVNPYCQSFNEDNMMKFKKSNEGNRFGFRTSALKNHKTHDIKKMYISHKMSDEEAVDALLDIGIDREMAFDLVERWTSDYVRESGNDLSDEVVEVTYYLPEEYKDDPNDESWIKTKDKLRFICGKWFTGRYKLDVKDGECVYRISGPGDYAYFKFDNPDDDAKFLEYAEMLRGGTVDESRDGEWVDMDDLIGVPQTDPADDASLKTEGFSDFNDDGEDPIISYEDEDGNHSVMVVTGHDGIGEMAYQVKMDDEEWTTTYNLEEAKMEAKKLVDKINKRRDADYQLMPVEVMESIDDAPVPVDVYDIEWDVDDDEEEDFADLPTEVTVDIPMGVIKDGAWAVDEYISNYLSDEYGFTHNGFEYDKSEVMKYNDNPWRELPSKEDIEAMDLGLVDAKDILPKRLQKADEAKVVQDVNDVWALLKVLEDDEAAKNLKDLIDSHVRSEEEIMDVIEELYPEDVTQTELNNVFASGIEDIVNALGLDVNAYVKDGSFVDLSKPSTIAAEMTDNVVYTVTDIEWDTDYPEDADGLPTKVTVGVPNDIVAGGREDVLNYISDYLSDEYGYCHDGFCVNDGEVVKEGTDDAEYLEFIGLLKDLSSASLTGFNDGDDESKIEVIKKAIEDKDSTALNRLLVLANDNGVDKTNPIYAKIDGALSSFGEDEESKPEEVNGGEKKFKGDDGEVKTLDNAGKKVVAEMTIEQDVNSAEQLERLLWGQGKENFIELVSKYGADEVMSVLEDSGITNLTQMNDYLWFEIDQIEEMLGGGSDDDEEL